MRPLVRPLLRPLRAAGGPGKLLRPLSSAVALQHSPLRPSYSRDIADYDNVIMHLGVGGFHRSHQAHYLHELLQKGEGPGWAICGVGLLPGDANMARALREQDMLYTTLTKGPSGESPCMVGSIMDYVLLADGANAAVARLASPDVKIVSLTITEKGYGIGVDGHLDLSAPHAAAEVAPGAPPTTAFGLIAAALLARRAAGVPAFTVLSCDNMPGNGDLARLALSEFVRAKRDAGCEASIELHEDLVGGGVAFPSTMVDRITPVARETDVEHLAAQYGLLDSVPVVCEEWKQWVVEDDFPTGRPAWDQVGATLVPTGGGALHAYESTKLRLLNGTHSAMAYLGYLAGHRLVADAMADPRMHGFVSAYLDEVSGTLSPGKGIDYGAYGSAVVSRFSNRAIEDTLLRLAEDGSQKLQTTMRPALLEQIGAGRPIGVMALAIGGWIRFMSGADEQGRPIDGIKDPQGGERLRELAARVTNEPTASVVRPMLHEYFGEDVAASPYAAEEIASAVARLNSEGSHAVLSRFA